MISRKTYYYLQDVETGLNVLKVIKLSQALEIAEEFRGERPVKIVRVVERTLKVETLVTA